MARYIDADALKLDIDLSKGASVLDMALSVLKAVKEAPTADVVPKSEVEKIFAELERLTKETMSADEKCMDDNSILEWRLCCLKDFLYWLAELKKKYTEGESTNAE